MYPCRISVRVIVLTLILALLITEWGLNRSSGSEFELVVRTQPHLAIGVFSELISICLSLINLMAFKFKLQILLVIDLIIIIRSLNLIPQFPQAFSMVKLPH